MGFASSYRRGASTNDPNADFALWLEQHPLLNGEMHVDLVTDGTTNAQEFEHSLGREYQFVIIGPNDGNAIPAVLFTPPTSTSSDAKRYFVVQPSAAGVITFTAWIC
jgi:hypothetical protein